jgi:hypothetical protein
MRPTSEAKPLTRLREAQGWAAFKPLVAREQGGRDEACTMLRLADVDANIERFMEQQGNRLESGRGGSFPGHTPPLSAEEEGCLSHWLVYRTAGLGQGLCQFAPLLLREPLTSAAPHRSMTSVRKKPKIHVGGSKGEKQDSVGMPQPTSYEKLPSTLYQVYRHAPQLPLKARGPKCQ